MAPIDAANKLLFEVPTNDGGKTKSFIAGTHLGNDFGWYSAQNTPIYAIQDGTVVDVFSVKASPTCGNSIVLQHNYSDGTHRWSAYIHLNSLPTLKVGQTVTRGQQIGVKGNTGNSNGTHLHIYVSDCTTKSYTWNTMKSLCNFEPFTHFYKSKSKTYCTGSSTYDPMKYIEDYLITYPSTVERDKNVKQVHVLIANLLMRCGAGTSNAEYDEYAKKDGIYNILEEKVNGNYCWYKIGEISGHEFWIASGGTRTEDLPAEKSKEEQLQDKVTELTAQVKELKTTVEIKETALKTANGTIATLNAIISKIKEALN